MTHFDTDLLTQLHLYIENYTLTIINMKYEDENILKYLL